MKRRHHTKWLRVPPWIVLAAVLGTLVLAGIMFGRDYRREQGHLHDMFLQRGEVLIHSLEIVGRVRFGQQWEEDHLQAFWNNLEENDNVLFIALTDGSGRVLALAGGIDPGADLFADPKPLDYTSGPIAPHYRKAVVNGRSVLLVYRSFWPQPRPLPRSKEHHNKSVSHLKRQASGNEMREERPMKMKKEFPVRYAWVAFDMAPLERLSHDQMRTAGVFIALFCFTGLAGTLALIWGYNSRLARRMYQDTNALAAELIGRLPIGVVIEDETGRVSLVNQSTMNISGLKESDFLGRTLAQLTDGRFPREEGMSGREIEISFTGGHRVIVALTSGPVISDDGHRLGQIVLMEDLGEVGRLKAELAKKERLATLGGLAAGLAHEIRNPLGAIRGLSQHLLNKLKDAGSRGESGPAESADPTAAAAERLNERAALEVVLTSVDRLNATITDFLEYAKPMHIKAEPLDMTELLRKMSVLASHDAQGEAVKINLDLPPAKVMINGDEASLSQAFLNLYLNAIQAAGTRQDGQGELVVALSAADGRAKLTFQDNGPGFTSEQLAQAFVPYFTTKADGTGLGLAMVEKTVRGHQGADIALSNSSSGGGLVTVTFEVYESGNNYDQSSEAADIDS